MSVTVGNVGAITLFIEDRHRSKKFYQDVFDLTPIFEDDVSVAFKFDNIVVNLLESREAPALIDPATVAPQSAGARFQLTAEVEDVDIECAQLALLGVIMLNGPMDRPWGIRTASFTDPDGHIWEIAHELPEAAAE